ncbi:MAG: class IV adenylate cyclase [Rhodothermales bacterium]
MTYSDADLQRSGFRLNVEIKARSTRHEAVRAELGRLRSRLVGTDHQVDTYFNVPEGRLKLREGTIENSLIHYMRSDQSGPKTSDVLLYRVKPDPALRDVLERALGVLVVVDKQREIHFVDNVKIHLDTVEGLGTFLEIEAIDADGSFSKDQLQQQCETFMDHFNVLPEDLLEDSYSDMLLRERGGSGT